MGQVTTLRLGQFAPSLEEDTPACWLVIVEERHVGLGFRDGTEMGFVATDPRFRLIEGSRFRRIEQLEQAARNLSRALSPCPEQDPYPRPRLIWSRQSGRIAAHERSVRRH
jgi:hypothetical protein